MWGWSGRVVVMAALCALVVLPGRALAHPGHDHKVMGTIVAIDGDHVTIKTSAGKERTFQIVPTTKFTRGKRQGAKEDLKIGLRLVVNVGNGVEPLKAKQIQYADTPRPPATGTAAGTSASGTGS